MNVPLRGRGEGNSLVRASASAVVIVFYTQVQNRSSSCYPQRLRFKFCKLSRLPFWELTKAIMITLLELEGMVASLPGVFFPKEQT